VLPAAGDEREVVGPAFQLVADRGDQFVEPAALADQFCERLARHGFGGGEDRGFDPAHPLAPAHRGRQVGELRIMEGIDRFRGCGHGQSP
jgi:hypothetical protein